MKHKSGYKVKFSGALSIQWEWSLVLSLLLLVLDGILLWYQPRAGLIGLCFTVVYLLLQVLVHFIMRKRITREMIRFAMQYSVLEQEVLQKMDLPCALTDRDGCVVWINDRMSLLTQKGFSFKGNVSQLFPEITPGALPHTSWESDVKVSYNERDFRAHLQRITTDRLLDETELVSRLADNNDIFMISLFDETDINRYIKENRDQKPVIGLIYIDNYEEVMERTDEVHQSLLSVMVERKVNKYFNSVNGLIKKLEKDKYLVSMRRKDLDTLIADRFSILEGVKTINIGNETSITVSIGIGCMGRDDVQNYEYARSSIEMALGRGGDQVVLHEGDDINFYGGRTQRSERNTRVRARVKAQALRELMISQDRVVAMGHNYTDMDSFGAAVGICRAAMTEGKPAHIVIGESGSNIRDWIARFQENKEYPADFFLTHEEAKALVDRNTAVVVVDTHRRNMVECPEILDQTKSIVVLDHHRQTRDTLEGAALSYIEPSASSACEMVAEVLQYFEEDVRLRPLEADCIYAGIVIDTQSFVAKTGVRTFEAAAYLRRCGADVTRVRKALRDNMDKYLAKAEAVQNAETYLDCYAISVCHAENLEDSNVVGAQAANDLLNIVNIKASFVLTPTQDKVFVSARSIDEVNVQIVMERLGGGGHMNIAGAQMCGMTVEEASEQIKNVLKEMTEEGAI